MTEVNCDNGVYQAKIQLIALFFQDEDPDNLEAIGEVVFSISTGRHLALKLPLTSACHGYGKITRRSVQEEANTEALK